MLDQLHRKISTVSLFAVLICTCFACSPSNPDTTAQRSTQETSREMKKTLAEYEATLDPSQYDQDVDVEVKKQEEQKQTPELQIPKDSTVVQETSQLGFRIQIYSSSNIDEAMSMKADVMAKLPQDSVYVVYDPPVYKIRLGDYPTRYDASVKLPSIVNMGYSDAWIVPDNIVRRKVVQVPRTPTP